MATTKKKTTSPSYLGDYASGNYTPSYDYVSGYYNQNAGYQNPSVYGYRGSRYNIPTNSGFSIPMKDNDPYWNLGAMLGGLWGAQYNKRGAERAGEEANAMLQDEYNRLMGVETPKQPTANDQMYDMAQKAGAIPERQAQIQMPGQEQTPKAEDLSKGLKYTDQQGNIVGPQQPDYKGEKLSYLDKKYGLINGQQHDNPEGDKKVADKTSQAVGTDISNIDVTKLPQGFNSDLLRANIVSKLKAAGRNEWQIAQAMQGIEPQILGKQREYNTQQFNNLYGMYDSLTKAGRIDEAGMVLDKMKQFNPEGAAMLTKNFDRLSGYQAKKNQIEDGIKLLRERGFSEEEIKDYERRALLGISGIKGGKVAGTSNGGTKQTNGNGYTKQDWDLFTHLEKKEKRSPAEEQTLKNLKVKIYGAYATPDIVNGGGDNMSQGGGDKPDPMNNWDSITNTYNKIINGEYGQDWNSIANHYEGKGLYGSTLANMIRDYGKQFANEQEQKIESSGENRSEALASAQRAGLYVNPYTGAISPAGPYDNPTEEQRKTYAEWKKRFPQFS